MAVGKEITLGIRKKVGWMGKSYRKHVLDRKQLYAARYGVSFLYDPLFYPNSAKIIADLKRDWPRKYEGKHVRLIRFLPGRPTWPT